MDLKAAVRSLLLGWYYPALGVLVACGVAVFIHARETPVYDADATYVVTPYAGPTAGDTTESVKTLDATRSRTIMTTLTEIVVSDTARSDAATVLGLDPGAVGEACCSAEHRHQAYIGERLQAADHRGHDEDALQAQFGIGHQVGEQRPAVHSQIRDRRQGCPARLAATGESRQ